MEGAKAAGIKPDERGHYPDTYKRPNHITFSTDSKYSDDKTPGGVWKEKEKGKWSYTPSDFVLSQHSPEELEQYFKEKEPDSELILPSQSESLPGWLSAEPPPQPLPRADRGAAYRNKSQESPESLDERRKILPSMTASAMPPGSKQLPTDQDAMEAIYSEADKRGEAGKYGKRSESDYQDYAATVAKQLGIESNPEFAKSLKPTLDSFDLMHEEDVGTKTPVELRPHVLSAVQYSTKAQDKQNQPGWVSRTIGAGLSGVIKAGQAVDRLNPLKSKDQWEFENQIVGAATDPARWTHPDQGFVSRNVQGAMAMLPTMGAAALAGGAPGVALMFGGPTAVSVEQAASKRGASPLAAATAGVAAGAVETVLFSKVPGRVMSQFGGGEWAAETGKEALLKYALETAKTGRIMTAAGLQAKLAEEGAVRLSGGKGKSVADLWNETIDSLPETVFQAALFHAPGMVADLANLPDSPSRAEFKRATGLGKTSIEYRNAAVEAAKSGPPPTFAEIRKQTEADLSAEYAQGKSQPPTQGEENASEIESSTPGDGDSPTSTEQTVKEEPGAKADVEQAALRVRQNEGRGAADPEVQEEAVTPPPASSPEITSIKNRVMKEWQEKNGLTPATSNKVGEGAMQKWLDQAGEKMTADPMAGYDMVARVNASPQKPISEVDQSVLQIHQRQMADRYAVAMDKQIAAHDAGDADALDAATLDVNRIRQQADDAIQAYNSSGTSASYSMLARKMEIKKDGSLEGLTRQVRSANGGAPLTVEQNIEIKKMADDLKAAQDELKAYQEKQDQAEEGKRQREFDVLHDKLVSQAAVKRQATINARTRDLLRTAKEHGLDPDELESGAKERAANEAGPIEEYNRAFKGLQKDTGLTPSVISKIENKTWKVKDQTGIDRTEKPVDILEYNGLDEKAGILAREYSVLGVEPDPQAIVDLLKAGPKKVPQWHEKLGEVAYEMAKKTRGDAWEPEVTGGEDGGFPWEVKESFSLGDKESISEPKAEKPRAKKAESKKKLDDAWAEFKTKFVETIKGTAPTSGGIPVEAINAGLKVIKAAAEYGIKSFTEFMKDVKERLGEKADELRPIFAEAWKKSRESGDVPGRDVEITDDSDIGNLARNIHREVVELGIDDREQAVDAVHDELKQYVPDITRRQTMDAMSGYGDYRELSKDEISVKMRGHKGELQQIAKLQDMESGKAPLKSGVEKREGTEEERRLTKLVNEKKKEGGYEVTDPDRQLKTAQGTAETYLLNRIADLKKEIDTGEKIVKDRKPLKTTKKIEALKEELAQVTKLHQEIFPSDATLKARDKAFDAGQLSEWDTEGGAGKQKPKRPLTDAERLENYKQRKLVQYADLQSRLKEMEKTGEIPVKKPIRPLTLDKEAESRNRAVDKVWGQFKELEANIRASHENRIEKLGSLATSLIQSNVLGSPTVVVHIAGAVAWKIPGILKDEISRKVLSKVVPGFKELSPMEGRSDIPAYLRALLNIKATAKNSMDQILHHGTESQKLYGERHDPQSWTIPSNDASTGVKKALRVAGAIVEMPGRSHAAGKEIVRTPAETLAKAKLMADAKEHGEDINNPEVQKRINQAALEWANRQILMQKSEGASALRSLASAKIDPKTGHKTAAGVVKEVFGRGILPVVRVGMNWAAELIERTVGGVEGTGKFALHSFILKDLAKLSPEAKEAIARKMVYGLSSLPVWALLGWYGHDKFGGFYRGRAASKKDENEGKLAPGEIQIGDVTISHHLTHSPELGVGHLFATLHKFLDETKKVGGDEEAKHSFFGAVVATMAGVMDQTPISSEARTFSQLTNPETAENAVGRLIKTMLIPAWISFLAKEEDPEKRDETGVMGPTMGAIPILRETLPSKEPNQPVFPKLSKSAAGSNFIVPKKLRKGKQ